LLERYHGSPATLRVSPERASLALEDSPATNPDATGGYYLQGELLGEVIDARVRSATGERRGLDDVMRALYARSRTPRDSGYTARDLETTIDSVCGCDLSAFVAGQVRGTGPIDVTPVLARLGLHLVVDTVAATDAGGRPLPDLRLRIDFSATRPPLHLAVTNPTTAWAVAGLRTGDQLIAINGATIRSWADLQTALRSLHVGDRAAVEIRRDERPLTIRVAVSGYTRPRVRFIDVPTVTPDQRSRRQEWFAGR